MAITSKVTTEEAADSRAYPYLGQDESDGQVVLFTAEKTGVTIVGTGSYDVGDWSEGWVEGCFEPLPAGSVVTLKV